MDVVNFLLLLLTASWLLVSLDIYNVCENAYGEGFLQAIQTLRAVIILMVSRMASKNVL